MNSNSSNLPPLGRDEAPWTDAEVQVREVLLNADATPPAQLEGEIMSKLDALDRSSSAARTWLIRAGLGAVAAGLVAAIWLMETSTDTEALDLSPNMEQMPVEAVEDEPAANMVNSVAVDHGHAEASGDSPEAELMQETLLDTGTSPSNPSPLSVERMEVIGGVQVVEIEQASEPEQGIQTEGAKPVLERRPATLKVKQ